MATYESIKYKISGTAITGVMQESENLDDVANKGTSRTNLGVAIGSDVQAFISATARTVDTSAPSGGSDGDIWYKYT